MGNDNSSGDADAYPHQQYEYDQQQIAEQKAKQTSKSHAHTHTHHTHQTQQDRIQPKPQQAPTPVQQVQYVPVPIQTQTISNQPINPYYGQQQIQQPTQQPIQQSTYPTLVKPAAAATIATVAATQPQQPTTVTQQQPIQSQTQSQPQPQPKPIATAAAVATTGAIITSQQQNTYPTLANTAQQPHVQAQQQVYYQQPVPVPVPLQQGYVQVKGNDGKLYTVPQGPPGTVPVVVQPQKPKPKPKPKRKKYKTWGVKIIPTSDKAKRKVQNGQYDTTSIVIGIICDGDKYDGYNRYGTYGAYGYSNYGQLDRKKFITMKVKVNDTIAIQQNTHKHWLEFWKNGVMYKHVIALDKSKKFQIRVGSTNHDYDVKLY